MDRKIRVAAIGDNCIDYYDSLNESYPGGNPVNVAVYIKRLGGESSYTGAVGTDSFGKIMISAIQNKGVDTSHIQVLDGKTAMGDKNRPVDIAKAALVHAKTNGFNVLILDTAGRLHIDEEMMQELQDIKAAVPVDQTLLVVDAMTGQDAVNVAEMFSNKVGIDGVVLTKLDGDTRGGAALSIRAVSGKPILYVGMGEKLSDLEQFYPDRMASRILGMGDVMSLIEKAQANIDEEKAKAMEQKMKKAQFDFNDYLDSMEQMRNMGGISSILNMLPGVGAKMKGQDLESMVDEKDMARKEAIVLSMTPKERENPDLINPSRKQRIAKGAGVDIAEVNRFIKQFEQSRKMMKQMTGMVGKGGKRGGFKLPF